MPIVVDPTILVYAVAASVQQARRESTVMAWCAVGFFTAISVAANVLTEWTLWGKIWTTFGPNRGPGVAHAGPVHGPASDQRGPLVDHPSGAGPTRVEASPERIIKLAGQRLAQREIAKQLGTSSRRWRGYCASILGQNWPSAVDPKRQCLKPDSAAVMRLLTPALAT